jgi:hypothetical protein
MTTPWQESTLCGGWARVQIPRPIEHGVEAPSASPSASLSTSKIRMTVERTGGSSRVEVSARTIDGSLLAGTQEGSPLHTWFRGPFGGQWSYTSVVYFHPALRAAVLDNAAHRFPGLRRRLRRESDPFALQWYFSLLAEWKYRLLMHFHPVLRKVVERYAARIVPISPRPR